MDNVNDLIIKLNKYNFVFDRLSDKEIQVKIMKNIYVQTVFSEDGSVTIKDVLKPGNILSGAIPSSMSTTMIYGSVVFFFLCALSVCEMYLNPSAIILLSIAIFISSFLFLLWVIYFTIRIESIKRLLIDWTENN
jgi:hypothetical protein